MESLMSKKSNEQSVNFAKKSLDLSLKYFTNFLFNQMYCTSISAAVKHSANSDGIN